MPCPDFRRTHPTRRTLLKLGAVGLTGLTLPNVLRAEKAGRVAQGDRQERHPALPVRRAEPPRHVRPEAGRPGRDPRRVQGDPDARPRACWSPNTCRSSPARSDQYAVVRSVRHNKSATTPGRTTRSPAASRSSTSSPRTPRPPTSRTPARSSITSARPTGQVPSFVALPTMIADGPFRTPGEFAGLPRQGARPALGAERPERGRLQGRRAGPARRRGRGPARRPEGDPGPTSPKLSDLADRTADDQGMRDYQARALDLLTSAEDAEGVRHRDEEPADCGTGTAGTPTARACCWPAGWSRPGCGS